MPRLARFFRPALVVFGAGGHACSVAEVAFSAGFEVRCFVDEDKRGSRLLGVPVIAQSDIRPRRGTNAHIAVGDNAARERWMQSARLVLEDARFPVLVHRTASVSKYARIGPGSIVMQNANIGSCATVGSFCIVNTGASVDHDCVLHDFSSVAPGAALGGRVRIGQRAAISIGAAIRHGSTVGDDSVLGANSYLHGDLEALVVAYGTPAKVVRPRRKGDPYL